MREFWHNDRLARLARGLALAFAAALVIGYLSDEEGKSLLKRGDFPGFYAPAAIVWSGQADRLYDPVLQRELENRHWPSFRGEFYMSVYPPYLAALLAPLGAFDALTARLIFGAICLAAFAVCMLVVTRLNPALERPLIAGVASLCVAPVFVCVFGGQNTPLSMLLYGAAIFFARKEGARAQFAAGACLGLWLFKPQFGLLAILPIVLARRCRMLAGFLACAAVYYLLGAAVSGLFWPFEWLRAVDTFAAENFVSNRREIVSLIGTARGLGLAWGLDAGASWLDLPAYAAMAASLGLLLEAAWRRPLAEAMLLLGPVVALVSPQTLFYDLGIPLVSCLACARLATDGEVWRYWAFALLAAGVTYFRSELEISLYLPICLLMLLFVVARRREIADSAALTVVSK